MKFHVRHVTTYDYAASVLLSHHAARLRPRDTDRQRCLSSSLQITPTPPSVAEQADYFGNWLTLFAVQQSHRNLTVQVDSLVEVEAPPLPDPLATPAWETVAARLAAPADADALEAAEFVAASPQVPDLADVRAYAAPSFPPGRPLLAAALDLTARIHTDFGYDPTATTVSTPLAKVLADRRGVCQDFTHLEIACLRAMGLAGRYVSGYLLSYPPPGQPKLVGADASHAWASLWVPGTGWVDLDPTNDMPAGDEHVTCAWGRDFDDVSPLKGIVVGGGYHSVAVAVDVTPTITPQAPHK